MGETQVVADGLHPWDVVTIDVYDVGMKSYDKASHNPEIPYEKIVVMADQFSRGVITVAVKGSPTSEKIARIGLDVSSPSLRAAVRRMSLWLALRVLRLWPVVVLGVRLAMLLRLLLSIVSTANLLVLVLGIGIFVGCSWLCL